MQEIYRSRDMTSLMSKKQFLEENDIPCRILLEGADITDMPSHPVFGLSYHLEEAASLVVDDEDGRKAWNLLNRTEYPAGGEADEDGIYLEPEELRESMESDVMDDGFIGGERSRDRLGRRIIPSILRLFCLLISVVWLFYAVVFVSTLWLEGQGTKDWAEDSVFIPLGIVMILIWVGGVVLIIYRARHRH